MSFAGKLLYKYYYIPKIRRDTIKRYGGKKNYDLMMDGERQMRDYALNRLQMQALIPEEGARVIYLNFLSGEKFIHQTLFCIYSLLRFLTPEEQTLFRFRVYEDGSLKEETLRQLQQKFPFIVIVPFKTAMQEVRAQLPAAEYPSLYKKIERYPIIYKLLFVNLGARCINPILDSDMLFVQRPEAMLAWMKAWQPGMDETWYIQDSQRYYGYTDGLLESLAGGPLPAQINGGLYIFDSSRIDFRWIEQTITTLEATEGPKYFLEQALISLIASGYKHRVEASKEDYIVFPKPEHVEAQSGVLHHFVETSKESYFKVSWRKLVTSQPH